MENVRPQPYPAMLLTCGLNDSRVAYWEIAKFAQRLREANTGKRDILCKVRGAVGVARRGAAPRKRRRSVFHYYPVLPVFSSSFSACLQIDMGAGHFSYSDRYQYLREKAFEYAWLMAELGVKV